MEPARFQVIDRVRFKAFKALADVEIPLSPLTVLVGPNGCGKTTVLEGIDLLQRLVQEGPFETQHTSGRAGALLRGATALPRILTADASGPVSFEMTRGEGRTLTWEAFPAGPDGEQMRFVVTSLWDGVPEVIELPRECDRAHGYFRGLPWAKGGPSIRLQLDPRALARPRSDARVRPRLEADGSGLVNVIAALAEERSGILERIEADLQKVIPNARRVYTSRESMGNSEDGRQRMVKRIGLMLEPGIRIPGDHLSEGTLLVLGLLTALHAPPAPSLLLLDDFDRGLHPRAQKDLVARFRDLLALRPDLQIVCTTHSPYALDYFEPDEVRVMGVNPIGHAFCRVLSSHPEWARWAESMKAGEFWSFVGEDWIFGSQDAAE